MAKDRSEDDRSADQARGRWKLRKKDRREDNGKGRFGCPKQT